MDLNQAQLNRLCNDGKVPVMPEFLARIALGLPAPKYFPLPDTIEGCAFILSHVSESIVRNEVTIVREIWISLSEREVDAADTVEKARVAYHRAPDDSDIKREAYARWSSLSYQEIIRAETLEEARVAYGNAPPRTTWKLQAIRKMAELLLKEETVP